MIIPITFQPVTTIGITFEALIKISNLAESNPDEPIILNFQNARFLSIAFIAGLHCLVQQWRAAGRETSFANISHNLDFYLHTVCFENGLQLPGNEKTFKDFVDMSRNPSKSYLPITYFPCWGPPVEGTPIFDTVWNCLVDAVNKILKNPPSNYWQIFPYFFDEIGDNVRDHSESSHGIFALQYYPIDKIIQVVIADKGVGVYKSYEKNEHFHPSSEVEAFEFAMEGKSSKSRPKNESRGFGISTSRELLVDGTKGTFIMWSGSTFYSQAPERAGVVNLSGTYPHAHYDGCFVVLQIPFRNNLLVDFNEVVLKG